MGSLYEELQPLPSTPSDAMPPPAPVVTAQAQGEEASSANNDSPQHPKKIFSEQDQDSPMADDNSPEEEGKQDSPMAEEEGKDEGAGEEEHTAVGKTRKQKAKAKRAQQKQAARGPPPPQGSIQQAFCPPKNHVPDQTLSSAWIIFTCQARSGEEAAELPSLIPAGC